MSILNTIKIEEKTIEKGNKSSFIFYHVPYNLGLTLGNCLRRTLMNNISGWAVCGVQIKDKQGSIKTKFSPIEGLDKTVFHLILALKEIVFFSETNETENESQKQENNNNDYDFFVFDLEIKNNSKEELVLKAKDLSSEQTQVRIKNPELDIAILSPDGYLQIKMYLRQDIGYLSERKQQKIFSKTKEEFIIVLDSNYSPVKNVFAKEEKIITSLIDEEEMLKLEIETNGSVEPKKALIDSLETFSNLLQIIKQKL